ncbi:prepilin-type N-terminal cleavage/methylation domain-containing protein [Patescibacteria group bacterium]|nr:prepilin-type N-terminal cleavage/methylation domain-containing protein [Candidatus Falkowbacteria bacterium]MBU3906312.1 prepilin-type N-terminal cleavage/methylation domain-containing protein [Patescibacteria group bacterium]MBU4015595.1 prepilin-type N-terminal cleavage/methylation domain-containing protein [Patescibacteria group bacterium]MBU4027131.1 prepilin-type N-terminal cleavage/methylation domain-containing protein [Patescibacteria group bacterium]MBU4072720.1 prepilin-type N-term
MINNKKGFTLVELLVVIAIIGLLSTLAVVALNNARQKSRDARRVADIKQVQTALEMYYNDRNGYPPAAQLVAGYCPNSGGEAALASEMSGCCLDDSATGIVDVCGAGVAYMNVIPDNPNPNGAEYLYSQTAASTYNIAYSLEGITGGIPAAGHIATPAGIANP